MEKHQLVQVVTPDKLKRCVGNLADRINRDYEGESLVVIGILKGSFVFMADLVRRLSVPVKLDFVRLASYGDKSESCGQVRITKDIEMPVKDRHVLVVEDIVDTGTTLDWYIKHLWDLEPQSVKVCALIDKPERRRVDVHVDYIGMSLEKGFLVGYGLDFSERYRNLPGIFEVLFD